MTIIRAYRESDSAAVGRLIADTYGEFNLSFATPEQKDKLLGPFRHARSNEPAHRAAIADVIRASMVFVAEDGGEIAGVLRGRKDRLHSLFVRADHQRQGIGRRLVECFELACVEQGAKDIRVASTLLAVPFYQKLGYFRSTGVRSGWSFGGTGLQWQPMKKVLVHE